MARDSRMSERVMPVSHTLILIQETDPALEAGLQAHTSILKESEKIFKKEFVSLAIHQDFHPDRVNQGRLFYVSHTRQIISGLFFHFCELCFLINNLHRKEGQHVGEFS